MVPWPDTRIRSIIKAIEQVIVPAIGAGQRMAIEQAEISAGHLRVLESQWKYILPVARLELLYMIELADAVAACDPSKRGRQISAVAAAARRTPAYDFDGMRDCLIALGEHVEDWIVSMPHAPQTGAVRQAVLDHARRQAELERAWFAASRIGASSDSVSLCDLLSSVVVGQSSSGAPVGDVDMAESRD